MIAFWSTSQGGRPSQGVFFQRQVASPPVIALLRPERPHRTEKRVRPESSGCARAQGSEQAAPSPGWPAYAGKAARLYRTSRPDGRVPPDCKGGTRAPAVSQPGVSMHGLFLVMELACADCLDDFLPRQPELLLRRFVAEGRSLAPPLGIQVVHSSVCAPAKAGL